MRAVRSVVGTFLVIGVLVLAAVEVRRHRAQAEAFVAADDFSGERAFRDLEQLVKLGPRPPASACCISIMALAAASLWGI